MHLQSQCAFANFEPQVKCSFANCEPDQGGEKGEDLGQQEQGAQGAGEAGSHAGEGDRVDDDYDDGCV